MPVNTEFSKRFFIFKISYSYGTRINVTSFTPITKVQHIQRWLLQNFQIFSSRFPMLNFTPVSQEVGESSVKLIYFPK